VAFASLAFAQTPSTQPRPVDPAKRAAERIRALQKESEELAARERTLLVELRKLEVDRQLKSEEVTKHEHEAAEVEKKLAATAQRLNELRDALIAPRPR
jgi:septal ring factor EnvC (AmiA/AmiB activator)